MKQRVGVATVVLAGVVGGFAVLTGVPGLAMAADGCKASKVCIFDDNNFKNRIGMRDAGKPRKDVTAAKNDRMDSWKNNTTTNAAWYYNFTYENSNNCRNMPKNSSDGNINVFNSDELSSWRTDRGC